MQIIVPLIHFLKLKALLYQADIYIVLIWENTIQFQSLIALESKTTFRATVLLYSDKENMFRRERPPCAGKGPNDRASPPCHTPLQLVSSFCCFPTTVYMQAGSFFIFSERRSKTLCTLPRCSVYQLGLCLSTTLPCLLRFPGREFQTPSHDTRFTIVCGACCLQFPQCLFVVYHHQGKSSDSTRQLKTSPFLTYHFGHFCLRISLFVTCK